MKPSSVWITWYAVLLSSLLYPNQQTNHIQSIINWDGGWKQDGYWFIPAIFATPAMYVDDLTNQINKLGYEKAPGLD